MPNLYRSALYRKAPSDVPATPTNTAPIMSDQGLTGSVTKNLLLTATGNLFALDRESANVTYGGSASGTYGSLVVNASTGAWTYTLNNQAAGLSTLLSGQTATDTFTVSASDGTLSSTKSLVITVNGRDNALVQTGGVVITGTPTVGQTLTVSVGTYSGTAPTSVSRQWYADDVAIAGATALTYFLTPNEVGKVITVKETATNANGSIVVTSAGTTAVAAIAGVAPANTAVPVITGTAKVGYTLSASTGTWNNFPTSYAYQWKRGGVNISGATSSTYTLAVADEGAVITVTVTATNATGSNSATSAGTSAVSAAAPKRYIRATPAGTQLGDSWANAAPLSALSSLIDQVSPGGEVWIRGETYNQPGQITISSTATRTADAPVRIRCVDVNGNPSAATFVGTRSTSVNGVATVPADVQTAAGAIDLNALAGMNFGGTFLSFQRAAGREYKYLEFYDFNINNWGTAISNSSESTKNGQRADLIGCKFYRIYCNNVGNGFYQGRSYKPSGFGLHYPGYASSIKNCYFEDFRVVGCDGIGHRLYHFSTDNVFKNCIYDGRGQTTDGFSMGVHVASGSDNNLWENCQFYNWKDNEWNQADPNARPAPQGDGVATERDYDNAQGDIDTYGLVRMVNNRFIGCTFRNNTDAGIDNKNTRLVVKDSLFKDNNRNIRFRNAIQLNNCTMEAEGTSGLASNGDLAQYYFESGSQLSLVNAVTSENPLVKVYGGSGYTDTLFSRAGTITWPGAAPSDPAGRKITMNPILPVADFKVTSPTTFAGTPGTKETKTIVCDRPIFLEIASDPNGVVTPISSEYWQPSVEITYPANGVTRTFTLRLFDPAWQSIEQVFTVVGGAAPPADPSGAWQETFDAPVTIGDPTNVANTYGAWFMWDGDQDGNFDANQALYGNDDQYWKATDDTSYSGNPTIAQSIDSAIYGPGPYLHKVENGVLKLKAYPLKASHQGYFYGYPYAAGMISTFKSHKATYGTWEVRMKAHQITKGAHIALWLIPVDGSWPPELDIVEVLAKDKNGSQKFFAYNAIKVNGDTTNTGDQVFELNRSDFADWHTYKVEVTPTTCTWWRDGVIVKQCPYFMRGKELYFLATLEGGGQTSWSGPIDGTTIWPQEWWIDTITFTPYGSTPPSGGGGGSNPPGTGADAYRVLDLDFTTMAANQVTITDLSPTAKTGIVFGSASPKGNTADLSTPCLKFSSTSNNILSVPDSGDWTFDGEFTIETEVYFATTATGYLVAHYRVASGERSWIFSINAGTLKFDASTLGTSLDLPDATGTYTYATGVWHRVGVERDANGNVQLYRWNGTAWVTDGSPAAHGAAGYCNSPAVLTIGCDASFGNDLVPNTYMRRMRIWKGRRALTNP